MVLQAPLLWARSEQSWEHLSDTAPKWQHVTPDKAQDSRNSLHAQAHNHPPAQDWGNKQSATAGATQNSWPAAPIPTLHPLHPCKIRHKSHHHLKVLVSTEKLLVQETPSLFKWLKLTSWARSHRWQLPGCGIFRLQTLAIPQSTSVFWNHSSGFSFIRKLLPDSSLLSGIFPTSLPSLVSNFHGILEFSWRHVQSLSPELQGPPTDSPEDFQKSHIHVILHTHTSLELTLPITQSDLNN